MDSPGFPKWQQHIRRGQAFPADNREEALVSEVILPLCLDIAEYHCHGKLVKSPDSDLEGSESQVLDWSLKSVFMTGP